MAEEYIRKQDALDAFGLSEKTRKYGGDHSGYDTRMLYEIQDTIESLEPADVVPVVRCDDCRYYGSRRWCELHSSVFDDNAFCSYSERREE
jgi:hypothetical protein